MQVTFLRLGFPCTFLKTTQAFTEKLRVRQPLVQNFTGRELKRKKSALLVGVRSWFLLGGAMDEKRLQQM